VFHGLLSLCVDAVIIYIVYLLARDIARILFGRRHTQPRTPRVVVPPRKEQKQTYHDVQDAKFKEDRS